MKHLLFAIFSISGLIYEVFVPHKPVTIEVVMPQINFDTISFELGCINTDLNCIDDHLKEIEVRLKSKRLNSL